MNCQSKVLQHGSPRRHRDAWKVRWPWRPTNGTKESERFSTRGSEAFRRVRSRLTQPARISRSRGTIRGRQLHRGSDARGAQTELRLGGAGEEGRPAHSRGVPDVLIAERIGPDA